MKRLNYPHHQNTVLQKKKAESEILKLKKSNIKFCIGRIFSFTDYNQEAPYVIPSIIKQIKFSKKKK